MTASPKTDVEFALIYTIYSQGALLGIIHVFRGLIGLTPLIDSNFYRELELSYNAFAKALLGFHDFGLDYEGLGKYFRVQLCLFQLAFGAGIFENGHFSGFFGDFVNYGLLFFDVMVLAIQYMGGISYKYLVSTMICLILLVARAIIIEYNKELFRPGCGDLKIATYLKAAIMWPKNYFLAGRPVREKPKKNTKTFVQLWSSCNTKREFDQESRPEMQARPNHPPRRTRMNECDLSPLI